MNETSSIANLTFLYQIVYDPEERKMKPLNPYAEDAEGIDLSFAGEPITDKELAFDYALGNLDISGRKLEKVSSYDPETAPIVDNPSYGKRTTHYSIWTKEKCKNSLSAIEKPSKVILPIHTGPLPSKLSVDRDIKNSKTSVNTPNNRNDKKIKQSQSSGEKVYYISKYFKDKILREDENGKTIANSHDTLPNNETDENSSADILNIYKSKPKSVIDSPGSNIEKQVHTKYNKDKVLINDNENQENILSTPNVVKFKSELHSNMLPTRLSKGSLTEKEDEFDAEKVQHNDDKRGAWFEELEQDTAVKDTKLIYNTFSVSPKDKKESLEDMDSMNDTVYRNNDTKNKILNSFNYNNSPASRQAFKPVMQNKIDCTAPVNSNKTKSSSPNTNDKEHEKTKKRNPFAKALNPSPQSGPKQDTFKLNESDK